MIGGVEGWRGVERGRAERVLFLDRGQPPLPSKIKAPLMFSFLQSDCDSELLSFLKTLRFSAPSGHISPSFQK